MKTPQQWGTELGQAIVESYATKDGIVMERVIKSIQSDTARGYRLALATTCTILLAALLYVAVQHHKAVNIANFWRQQYELKP